MDNEFEEIGNGPMQYKKWALWDKNDSVVGVLCGFKHDKYKGQPTIGINIQLTQPVDFLDYKDREISVGSVLSLPPAAILNSKVEEYEATHGEGSIVGKTVRVEYLGKGTTKEGNEVNTFSFKVAKSKVSTDLDEDL